MTSIRTPADLAAIRERAEWARQVLDRMEATGCVWKDYSVPVWRAVLSRPVKDGGDAP